MTSTYPLLFLAGIAFSSNIASASQEYQRHDPANQRPIIGILAQEANAIRDLYPDEKGIQSFIAASYVKFVESAGGRVVPVMIGRDHQYYKRIIDETNGVLLPGGAVYFNQSNGYADAGQMIYDYAVEINNRGDYYPIWGTCLGMELLAQAAIQGKEIRSQCYSKKVSLPLLFKDDFMESRLFCNASKSIIDILKSENVTVNSHQFCFTEQNFAQNQLNQQFRIMSTNFDQNGLEFISTFEHRNYPFYGVQFHPEKVNFEFKESNTTLHTYNSVLTSQYFANFFVEECRKSLHSSESDLQSELIYNYIPRYSGVLGSVYEQIYVFKES